MPKELERDLGLFATITVSIGAMVGSGVFVLPGSRPRKRDRRHCCLLSRGRLVLPAALSKAEMATASRRPAVHSSISSGHGAAAWHRSGLGTWFSLSIKGALHRRWVPYLVLLFDLPIRPVALTLAAVLILVNILGAERPDDSRSASSQSCSWRSAGSSPAAGRQSTPRRTAGCGSTASKASSPRPASCLSPSLA